MSFKKNNSILSIILITLLPHCKTSQNIESDTDRAFKENGKISYDIGFYAVDYEQKNGLLFNSTAKGELDFSGDQYIARNSSGFSSQSWEKNGIDGLYLKMVVLPNSRNGDPLKQIPELVKMKSGRVISIEECFCEKFEMTNMRINIQHGDGEIKGANVCVGANKDPKRQGILLVARISMARKDVINSKSLDHYFTNIDADITFQSKAFKQITQNLFIKNILPNDLATVGWPKSISEYEDDEKYSEKVDFLIDELDLASSRLSKANNKANIVCPQLDFALADNLSSSFESEVSRILPLSSKAINERPHLSNLAINEIGTTNAVVTAKTRYYFDALYSYNKEFKGKGFNVADVFNKLDETDYTNRSHILTNQHYFNIMVNYSKRNGATPIVDTL